MQVVVGWQSSYSEECYRYSVVHARGRNADKARRRIVVVADVDAAEDCAAVAAAVVVPTDDYAPSALV